ncbi:MAG: NADP(H)-dependent aldo-keto reductase [Sphingobacteriales bacterium]|jgi:aryl-alcohol dehydrogenase-like predicted oxidoreductase|nr:MAG: NADP(H)-dependent aldo-keto reductase [Sphingobacteriales bacterium]
MEYNLLPNTNINVSKICLGTMTWGEQNTEAEAHEQLDYAINHEINFIDTAELYAVPAKSETQGRTETYIGTWLNKRKKRDDLIIASKAAGPGAFVKHIRSGPKFNKEHLTEALNNSLKRLQTDYIDIYQLHWPERPTNYFGALGYQHKSDDPITDFRETLTVLNDFIKEGKIRYIGLSNETPWGTMQYIRIAEKENLPKVITIQNPYSLINRTFEIGLSEISIREQVGLLAYSPLGGGLLSNKYLGGNKPEGARYTLWANYFTRYSHPNTMKAVEKYGELAQQNGLSLAQMALAFVNTRNFLTANIIGATSIAQLKENIDSINIKLSDDVLKEIERIHLEFPNPAP